LVHEVLDVADVGVADAIALAASSTVDAEKRACGLLANADSRDTTGVYSVSTVLQTRLMRYLLDGRAVTKRAQVSTKAIT
jgi:hypothetical protein